MVIECSNKKDLNAFFFSETGSSVAKVSLELAEPRMNPKSQSANFPLTSSLNYTTDPCASTTPVQAVLGFEPQVSDVLSWCSTR